MKPLLVFIRWLPSYYWTLGLLLLYMLHVISSANQWTADSITPSFEVSSSKQAWTASVTFLSNGEIYSSDGGQFRIYMTVSSSDFSAYYGATQCIPINSGAVQFSSYINDMFIVKKNILDETLTSPNQLINSPKQQFYTSLSMNVSMPSIFSTSANKFIKAQPTSVSNRFVISFSSVSKQNLSNFEFSVGYDSCSTIRTVRYWQDPLQWSLQRVPTASDDVIIPSQTGVIQMVGIMQDRIVFQCSLTIFPVE